MFSQSAGIVLEKAIGAISKDVSSGNSKIKSITKAIWSYPIRIIAAFIATNISVLAGIGFVFGTTLSVYLSVIFSIISFNAVSFFFLKATSEEVIEYLKEVSK